MHGLVLISPRVCSVSGVSHIVQLNLQQDIRGCTREGGRWRFIPARYWSRIRFPSWQFRWRHKAWLLFRPSTWMLIPHSISVLQWLLNAETSHPTSSPPHRLNRFFTTLYSTLRNPSRAVFQFYPSSDDQIQLITSIAQKAGFGGGVIVDYPNSKKAKKVFLCLFVGSSSSNQQQLPKALEGEVEDHARFERRREKEKKRDRSGKRKSVKDRNWILKKKEASHAPWNMSFKRTDATCSCTAKGARKVFLGTPSTRAGSGVQHFDISTVCRYSSLPLLPAYPCNHTCFPTKRFRQDSTASAASFLIKRPCSAAILIRLPPSISAATRCSSCSANRSTTPG